MLLVLVHPDRHLLGWQFAGRGWLGCDRSLIGGFCRQWRARRGAQLVGEVSQVVIWSAPAQKIISTTAASKLQRRWLSRRWRRWHAWW